MVSCLHQLKYLLWKNWILRKRHKMRFFMEFIWPLFLFLILMWIRTRGYIQHKPDCHVREKALPSVSGFEFVQNYLCTFNNTCYDTIGELNEMTWKHSRITNFTKDSLPLLRDIIENPRGIDTVSKLWDVSRLYMRAVRKIIELNKDNGSHVDLGTIPLGMFIHVDNHQAFIDDMEAAKWLTADEARDFLQVEINLNTIKEPNDFFPKFLEQLTDCKYDKPGVLIFRDKALFEKICKMDQISRQLFIMSYIAYTDSLLVERGLKGRLHEIVEVEYDLIEFHRKIMKELDVRAAFKFIKFISNALDLAKEMSSTIKNHQGSSIAFFSELACGKLHHGQLPFAIDPEKMEKFKKFKQKLLKDSNKTVYETYQDASPYCNKVFVALQKDPMQNFIWNMLKPILRGQLYFSPDTPFTRKILTMVGEKFSKLEELGNDINKTLDLVNDTRLWIIKNDLELQNMKEGLIQLDEEIQQNTTAAQYITTILPEWFWLNIPEYKDGIDYMRTLPPVLEDISVFAKKYSRLLGCIKYASRNHTDMFTNRDKLVPYQTELEAINDAIRDLKQHRTWAVVAFTNLHDDGTAPNHIKYKIRMNSEKVDSTRGVRDRLSRKFPRRDPMTDIKPYSNGFIFLQEMIEQSIVELRTGLNFNHDGIVVYIQQFPFYCYVYDIFIKLVSKIFPLFMILAWIYAVSMVIKNIVLEKELKIREVMKVMGLSNNVIWLGWYVDALIVMSLSAFVLSLILKFGRIVPYSDFSLILLFMFSFVNATIFFCFLLSTFFQRANSAAAAGGVIFLVTFLPFTLLQLWEEEMVFWQVLMACFLSNISFGYGCGFFAKMEEDGVGAQWWNLEFKTDGTGAEYNMAWVLVMFWIDSIIYLLLALYIEAVLPGSVGIPKKWYFFVQPSYWNPKKNQIPIDESKNVKNEDPAIEPEPTGLRKGVEVSHLSKTFSNGRVALSDLTVTFFEDQITSFLGHNGAGKTTTMSILCGIFPPTSGTAKIYDRDIITQMPLVRESLGICPQYNVLFERLNVEEHMIFYSGLKGHHTDQVTEISKMLVDLGIPHKRKEYPKNLSGGMKRKLCVAIAFIGGSKTVFLDEPTSGVDPYSRQAIWDLLIKYKKGRTIILSTHFMDEADILGDRIAIISKGKLKACGSSLFLKGQFGLGYSLRMVKSPNITLPRVGEDEKDAIARMNDHTEKVTGFVKRTVDEASLVDDIGSEIVVLLPYSTQPAFPILFKDLDGNIDTLEITSYGMSDTTLEDVFLKITLAEIEVDDDIDDRYKGKLAILMKKLKKSKKVRPISDGSEAGSDATSMQSEMIKKEKNEMESMHLEKATGCSLIWMQFWAIFVKRFRNSLRNKKAIFFENIVPPLFIFFTLLITTFLPSKFDMKAQWLTPWSIEAPNYMFFSEPMLQNLSDYRINDTISEITGPVGIGTQCLRDQKENEFEFENDENLQRYLCDPSKWSQEKVDTFNSQRFSYTGTEIANCSCETGYVHCEDTYELKPPPELKLEHLSGSSLLDVSKMKSVSEWLVKTYTKYEAKRYGGYEFQFRPPYGGNMSEFVTMLNFISQRKPRDLGQLRIRGKNITEIKIWYENKGWIASTSYLNSLHNVLLRQHLPPELADSKNEYGISAYNHPLNYTVSQKASTGFVYASLGLTQAICVIFALSAVPASFTVYLIDERVRGGKHLHLVSGVKPVVYWCSNYVFDGIKYLLPIFVIILIFLAFNAEAYIGKDSWCPFVVLLILFGFAAIPMMYPFSHVFQVPATAFVALACLNLFIGITATLSAYILGEFESDQQLVDISLVLQDVFLIFPQYCLGWGLITLVKLNIEDKVAKEQFELGEENIMDFSRWEWRCLGKLLLCLFIEGIFFFILNLMIEYRRQIYACCTKKRSSIGETLVADEAIIHDDFEEDQDVLKERERVNNNPPKDAPVLAKNMTKIYRKNMRPSVNKICFAMDKGECFGLLGVNGAGKSSTFKMLTGCVAITSGSAFITGLDVQKEIDEARQHFGYCPQEDGIDPFLNTYEQLELYGRLRGMKKEEVKFVTERLIKNLGLQRSAKKLCGTYSGGNKRKVSTAVALIGDPDVVFLDEPTTGMDPGARRKFWKVILKLLRSGKSVVLTSHSMEECEALCSKIAIMVNGKYKCLGSLQHLKNRFGNGYTLVIRFNPDKKEEFLEELNKDLPTVELIDIHMVQMKLRVPQEDAKLSKIFDVLSKARIKRYIDDYSVSQTTLDDIFVKFASTQKEEKDY